MPFPGETFRTPLLPSEIHPDAPAARFNEFYFSVVPMPGSPAATHYDFSRSGYFPFAAASACLLSDSAGVVPRVKTVADLDLEERVIKALELVPGACRNLAVEDYEKLQKCLGDRKIQITLLIGIPALIAVQFTPLGPGVDVLIMCVGWFSIGNDMIHDAADLLEFALIVNSARSDKDLDEAAGKLAEVIVGLSVDAFVGKMLKLSGWAAKSFRAYRNAQRELELALESNSLQTRTVARNLYASHVANESSNFSTFVKRTAGPQKELPLPTIGDRIKDHMLDKIEDVESHPYVSVFATPETPDRALYLSNALPAKPASEARDSDQPAE